MALIYAGPSAEGHVVKDDISGDPVAVFRTCEAAQFYIELDERVAKAESQLAIALGANKPDKPATPTQRARSWALEAAQQKERADTAERKLAEAQARIKELEDDWLDNRDVLLQTAMVIDAAEGFKARADAAEAQLAQLRGLEPDWSTAPPQADYHSIDKDGQGIWWSNAGIVLGDTAWYHDEETHNRFWMDIKHYDLDGLDWQNSLRARPGIA
jgi:hypothetical protein